MPVLYKTTFSTFVNGSTIPRPPPALSLHTAGIFDTVQIHTGIYESECVGVLLLKLSAQPDTWHEVPWRMLRNEFYHLSPFERLKRMFQRQIPLLQDVHDGQPLLVGIKDCLDKELVTTRMISGETYLMPTERLLACLVTQERPMTLERHIFPFGAPPGFSQEHG